MIERRVFHLIITHPKQLNYMKKILLSLAFSWMAASSLFAAKAKPGVCRLMMTDGSYVSATLKGDENFHYYTLLDGTPLQKMTNGTYEISSTQALQARLQASMARKTRACSIGNQQYFPHLGTPKALVILVEFQDVKFKSTSPAATFNHREPQ
jgi:immune inhibitor A